MNQGNDTKKRKKWKHLSARERYNIELLLKEGYSVKAIAAHLDRDRRTIQETPMKGLTPFNQCLQKFGKFLKFLGKYFKIFGK